MKKLLALVLSISMVISFFSFGTLSVSASTIGTTPQNPIILNNGEWYQRCWTNGNYDAVCYNKIVAPSRGYILFDIEKPVDSEGEVSTFHLKLYNSSGTIIWEGSKSSEKDIFNSYYNYKIPVAAGTYFMNIDPSFYVYSSSYIYTDYRFTFVANDAWEIEKNDDFDTATSISLNKTYSAILEEDDSNTDYFKVYLTKGKKYNVSFGNYNSDINYSFYDLDQDSKSFTSNYYDWYYGKESIKNTKLTWSFTAQKTGYHYIKVDEWPDTDIEYTVLVTAQTTPVSTCKLSLSAASYTYNGKTKKPTVTAKDPSGKRLTENKDYTVTYASGRKKVGKYKVTVTMKGNYSGSKTLYFTINPKATSVKKVTAAKKSLKVSIKKQTKEVTGYEIQYSTSKKFKSAKKVTIKKAKTTSTTIKKLKAKKTYYVRVRTYKTVNGKKYYSAWSKAKSKKTK